MSKEHKTFDGVVYRRLVNGDRLREGDGWNNTIYTQFFVPAEGCVGCVVGEDLVREYDYWRPLDHQPIDHQPTTKENDNMQWKIEGNSGTVSVFSSTALEFRLEGPISRAEWKLLKAKVEELYDVAEEGE